MADINAAIQQAKQAASEIVDDAEVIEEILPATTGASDVVVNYAKLSMETLATSSGISNQVDEWVKVNEFGLTMGTDKELQKEILVDIDMTEGVGFFVKESIKWGNSPVKYASRYDGPLSDQGEPWAEVVSQARAIDPRAKVYPSADILMTLAEDVKLKKGKLDAGVSVGHTLSMSNWGNWTEFYRQVMRADKLNQVVRVKLTSQEVNGKNGYTWGVIEFELAD